MNKMTQDVLVMEIVKERIDESTLLLVSAVAVLLFTLVCTLLIW